MERAQSRDHIFENGNRSAESIIYIYKGIVKRSNEKGERLQEGGKCLVVLVMS
jgi:hypothetical protein